MKLLQRLFKKQQETQNKVIEDVKVDDKIVYSFGNLNNIFEKDVAINTKEIKDYKYWFDEQLNRVKDSLRVKATDSVMAMDNASGVIDGEYYSNSNYNLSDKLIQENLTMGFAQLSLLIQVPIIANACRVYTDEMLRAGWEFVCDDEDTDATKVINDLNNIFKKTHIKQVIRNAMLKIQQLGGVAIYPKFKGDDDKRMTQPLKINNDTIAVNSLLGYSIIEPTWCTPTSVNYSQPFDLDFYSPTKYNVMGVETDVSRLIILVTEELPNLLKPVYRHYGISLTQKLLKAVSQFSDVRDQIASIIAKFNLTVLKTPLAPANSDPVGFINRIKSFIKGRNNFGILAVDFQTEAIEQLTMSLAGLDDLLSRYAEIMCIESQEPATKLLGISPRGFSTNDESGHRNFNDLTAGNQDRILKPLLMQMVKIELLNIGVDMAIIEKIDIRFNKLMESNKLEDAQIAEINSRTAMNNVNTGLTSQEEERQILIDAPDSFYSGLNPDEIIEQPEPEPKEVEKPTKKPTKK